MRSAPTARQWYSPPHCHALVPTLEILLGEQQVQHGRYKWVHLRRDTAGKPVFAARPPRSSLSSWRTGTPDEEVFAATFPGR